MRRLVLLLFLAASAAISHGQAVGGNGVPGSSPGLAANTYSGIQKAPGFFPQSVGAGPYAVLFDDYFTALSSFNAVANAIASPSGQTCGLNATFTNSGHPGNIVLQSGTVSGAGLACGYDLVSSIVNPQSTPGWTWETAVDAVVLPGTTAATYQAGISGTPNASPWTNGIGFILGSTNSPINDWFCRYGTTSTDSGVAAAANTWVRLSLVQDGTNMHWYINGVEATACQVAIASLPTSAMFPASWTDVAGSVTSVNFAVDYVDFQRAVVR